MLPLATRSAVFAFAGSTAMLVIALLANSQTAVMFGAAGLLGLSLSLALTVPLAARLRRQRVEFAWWLGQSDPARSGAGVVAGASFEVRCYVRNRSRHPLRFTELLPVVPNSVRISQGLGADLWLPPRARTEFRLRMSASAAGRVVLQGLAVAVPGPFGLFLAPLYFPSSLVIRVLPRAAAQSLGETRVAGGDAVERSGRTPMRRRGAGLELHEIRELQPGDPFKSIAWKASARAGKLLVREVEREVQDTLHLVLDVSGSMRGGLPGDRKLDHCIELCALLARQALERGDRVGLTTVDGRILSHVQDAEGLPHMLRIYEALLSATEVVCADLTDIDDDAVVAMVGAYLKRQEGFDVSAGAGWNLEAMSAHVARALQTEPNHGEVVAGTPEHALLRRFCRARGLALPYRPETRGFAKTIGLGNALRQAVGATRSPRSVLVISDFDGVVEREPLKRVLRLLKARHHNVAFVVPDAESFAPAPSGDLGRSLQRVYALEEQTRLDDVQADLGRLGLPVLSFDRKQGAAAIMRRAAALRRVA
jgi:uncharacterized protein (DUF58 family)